MVRKHWTYSKSVKKKSWGKAVTYRGITYRSTWESYVACLLFYAKQPFKFEPKRFFFSTGLSYLPDFYLEKFNVFLEVKGFLSEKNKAQHSMFQAHYPYRLIYIGKVELEIIYGRPASYISKIDMDKYVPTVGEIERLLRFIRGTKT